MSYVFPSAEWLQALENKLNTDPRYAEIARNWEGALFFDIEPEGTLKEKLTFYLDLWHGKCRNVEYQPALTSHPNPAFILQASYKNITDILSGKVNSMTAMLTNKLKVRGSMAYMLRNVPTVLDFVRCAQEVTKEIL